MPDVTKRYGYGVDTLLAAYYESVAIKAHYVGAPAGLFLNTGKPGQKTLQNMTRSHRYSALRSQSAPFDYDHKYPLDKLMSGVLKDAILCEQLAKEAPDTHQFFSPFCEHGHGRRTMEPVFDKIRRVAPSVFLVNTVYGMRWEEVPGTITEIHIEDSKMAARIPIPKNPYIVSFDGFGGNGKGDFQDANVPAMMARFSGAIMILGWGFRCNRKFGHLDKRDLKTRNADPDVNYLRGLYEQGRGREGTITWKGKDLYKASADDHGKGDWKDNNAMCILSGVDRDKVEVKDIRGNVIDVMTRYRPNHTRGARYYSRLASCELGDRAARKSGSRLVLIHNRPPTDADLRSHDFV